MPTHPTSGPLYPLPILCDHTACGDTFRPLDRAAAKALAIPTHGDAVQGGAAHLLDRMEASTVTFVVMWCTVPHSNMLVGAVVVAEASTLSLRVGWHSVPPSTPVIEWWRPRRPWPSPYGDGMQGMAVHLMDRVDTAVV